MNKADENSTDMDNAQASEPTMFKAPMPEVIVEIPDASPAESQDENDDSDGNFRDVKSDLLSVYSFQSSSGYASSMCSSVTNSTWNVFREKKCSTSDLTDGELDYKDPISPGFTLSPGPVSPFSDCDGQRSPARSGANRSCFVFDVKSDHLTTEDPRMAGGRERSLSDSDCARSSAGSSGATEEILKHPYKKRLIRGSADEGEKSVSSSEAPTAVPSGGAFPSLTISMAADARSRGIFLTQDLGMLAAHHFETAFPAFYASPVMSPPTLADHFRLSAFTGLAESSLLAHNGLLSRSQNIGPSLLSLAPTESLTSLSRRFASVPLALQFSGCSTAGANATNSLAGPQLISTANLLGTYPTDGAQTPSHRYRCRVCYQSFKSHGRLVKHTTKNHRENSSAVNLSAPTKAHQCAICQKSFSRSDMLTRHMRLHTGVKPYSCRTCGQMFSRSDHLSTHKRTHTGEKPYQCPICPYAASRRDLITRHVKTHGQEGHRKGSAARLASKGTKSVRDLSVSSSIVSAGTSRPASNTSPSDQQRTVQETQRFLTVTMASKHGARRHSTDSLLSPPSFVHVADCSAVQGSSSSSNAPSPGAISHLASSISEINVRSPKMD
uniref:C2H2-type domain-containing protein n=1 Tax=Trichuris muris TaxID=70415 RepID=A0A5S6QFM4_TRIMR